MRDLVRLLWQFSRPVDRRSYLALGILFAVVKYAGDVAIVWGCGLQAADLMTTTALRPSL